MPTAKTVHLDMQAGMVSARCVRSATCPMATKPMATCQEEIRISASTVPVAMLPMRGAVGDVSSAWTATGRVTIRPDVRSALLDGLAHSDSAMTAPAARRKISIALPAFLVRRAKLGLMVSVTHVLTDTGQTPMPTSNALCFTYGQLQWHTSTRCRFR
jgi:hypothetical protein